MMDRSEFKIELEKWTKIGKTMSMLYLMTGHIMNNNTFRPLLSKTETKAIRTVQYTFGQFKCKSDDLLFDTLDISLDIFPKSLYLSEVFYGDYFDLHAINNKLWDHIEKKTGFAEIKNQIEVHASAIEKRFELWDSCLLYLDVFLKLQEIYMEKAKQSNLLPQTNIELLEKAKKNMIVFRSLILTTMKEVNTTPDPSGLKTHKDFIEMSVDELIKELELYAVNSAHELFHRIYP